MPNEEVIYIIDQITPKGGQGKAFFQYYVDNYVPVAEARGLKLEHRWVQPPMWMEGEQTNTLHFVWSAKGVMGYWGVEAQARWDPTSSHFWRDIEPMIVSRTRSVLAEESDIASLTNV